MTKIIELQRDAELRDGLKKFFPHVEVRPFQAALANQLYDELTTTKNVVVEAPTGLGKTSAVWAAVKAYAEEKRLRILWLTRTASQVRHVASETGATPVYGRKLLCLHEVISKVDQRRFNQTCRVVRSAGRCPYYPGRPRAVKAITIADLKSAGAKITTCPYEIQLLNLSASTALAATHRQLPVTGWLLAKWRWSRERTLLIIDEGQHIIQESLSMVKDSLSLKALDKARSEAHRYGFNDIARELEEAITYYNSLLQADGEAEVEDRLPSYEDLVVAGEEVQERKLKEGYVPASHLLSLADFKVALAGSKPLLVREGKSVRLEAVADPQEVLKKTYSGWARTVTMSATISAEFLENILGEEVTLLRAGWPYGENLRAWLVKGLTTRYEARDEKLVEDIRWVVGLIVKSGKRALVFLPSFDMLEAVRREDVLYEDRGLPQESVDRLVSEFLNSEKPLIAVYNGRLSEGIDLSSDLVFLVGVPFAPPTPRTAKLLRRLSEIFGGDENRAKLHGIILPGLWAALQAAGRAIRGPEDSADVYLIDDRYVPMTRLLPR
jgi:DNA excision repair protein ERCC-2